MLMERHMAKKIRMGKGRHHLKGAGKENGKKTMNVLKSLCRLIEEVTHGG